MSGEHWPEGGLPHGEHPYDYGYSDEDEFDEWENAGRYLPHMLYPTLRPAVPEERE